MKKRPSKKDEPKAEAGKPKPAPPKARGSKKAASSLEPQMASTVTAPPEGAEWLHEFELDGYRLLARLDKGKVRLENPKGQNWTAKFPEVAAALATLPLGQAVFDGEIALIDTMGKTNLGALDQAIRKKETAQAIYFPFDLVELEGQDLKGQPLATRKQRLAEALAAAPPRGPIRQSLYMVGEGASFFAQACEFGLLGVVSKRLAEPYLPGDAQAWRKARCPQITPEMLAAPAAEPVTLPHRPLPPVRFTSPDRILYPDCGVTKLELAQFYTDIADWILPQLQGRPLSIVRCPDGLSGPQFFQKNAAAGVSASLVKQVPIEGGYEAVLAVSDLNDLLALVQISTLEIHVWGSTLSAIERPDRLVIDLDPDPNLSWDAIAATAHDVRARLAAHKLESFLKTTGGKGLHVVAPLAPVLDWPTVKEFARQFAAQMASDAPDRYTIATAKAARRGKVLIDYLRNARGSTAVVAYSTRAQPGAPVSVPLAWEELTSSVRPARRTIRDVGQRLASLSADPWREIGQMPQTLPGWVLEKLRHGGRKKG